MCGRAGGWATCAGRCNGGSIYLADQKIPLAVPRVRDRLRTQEVPLPTYERLQAPRTLDAGLLHKVLGGLSTREYERCAEAVPEAFGLSASTVSRRFKRASARKLQELLERRLDRDDVVARLLDGKTFAEDEMVAAVGITITGRKCSSGSCKRPPRIGRSVRHSSVSSWTAGCARTSASSS